MCCSSEEAHPFNWTKPIISQHKYDSRKLSSASLVLAACLSWYIGGLEILVFREGLCFPLKKMTVITILTSPNFAGLEAGSVHIRKQVPTPTSERHSRPVLAPYGACTRSMEKSVTGAKSRTGFHIHLVIPLGLYS